MSDKFEENPNPIQSFCAKHWVALITFFSIIFVVFVGGYFFVHSAHEIKQHNQEQFDKAIALIDQENYIAAWEILDEIGISWKGVKKTMEEIMVPYFDQKILQALPEQSYEEQMEALKGYSVEEERERLMKECQLAEADRLYGQEDYVEALALYLGVLDPEEDAEQLLDCIRKMEEKYGLTEILDT